MKEKGHCGGSSIAMDNIPNMGMHISPVITVEEMDKIKKVMDDCTSYIIVAKPKDIPGKFKEWRIYRDLTLREVEIATGVSNAYLSQIETGKIKKPSFDVVCKLCDIYKIRLIVGWN